MSAAPRTERATQDRVVNLFTGTERPGALGYRYLGDWSRRAGNRGIEEGVLRTHLESRGYGPAHMSAALEELRKAIDVTGVDLYQANMRTYQLLRYGASVKVDASGQYETVHLIDWDHPEANDFALAQEVTLTAGHERRPDLVLYINGLAIAVIELKRSSVEVADGVRQLVSNQQPAFNMGFFATVQLVMAGSDAQGLRYGTTGTPEQFFVEWKVEGQEAAPLVAGSLLDRPLAHLCDKARLLDVIRHCVIFDGGKKKVPRPHQYFAIKAAQKRLSHREGGVIWHTQGSGKSILMVLLAKWLLEHDPDARILIVTDRDELDKQIEGVMRNAGVTGKNEPSPRITTRAEFVEKLGASLPRLLCALVHKFNPADLEDPPPPIGGSFYVFVDECHRTQGGAMNRQMKRWLADATFVGFTGTPLLRADKKTTRDMFGTYIHTYKFHQGVADGVILDLKYEARDVPQRLTTQSAIDEWFDGKTRNLNNFQKAVLRKRWATMEKLMSSGERKNRIIASIVHDFGTRPRLNNDRGTAILVAAEIYDACHYFRLFQATPLGPNCGIITSYEPNHNAISREPVNGTERYKYDTYVCHVLQGGQSTTQYEDATKRRFIEEPATMKLLIVVSKLLTGFDAPSCTYIYLDGELRDHNLFQAICRTNRLDGDDKGYGHVVDFKELFKHLQEAIAVYSSDELDTDGDGDSENNVHLKDWRDEGRKKLDEAREALRYLCESVALPRGVEQHLHYFCGDASKPEDLGRTEPLRISFYKAVTVLARAYAAIAQELAEAGYSPDEAIAVQRDFEAYIEVRDAIKHHSGEELDLKPYEADMRHLINTYIQADHARDVGNLDEVPLIDLIVKTGVHDAIAKKLNPRGTLSRNAVAEGIINNVRKTIIRDQLTDPRFYELMSTLLYDLIHRSREEAAEYEAFLRTAYELACQLVEKRTSDAVPKPLAGNHEATVIWRNLPTILNMVPTSPGMIAETPGRYEVTHNEAELVELALNIDLAVRTEAPAGWRGDQARESQVKNVLHRFTNGNATATMALFELVKNQPRY